MPAGFIRIISRPPGGAPDHIRDQWIGLVLPAEGKWEGALMDVSNLTKVAGRKGGIQVNWDNAMALLGTKSPEAREWWESHVPPMTLIFSPECLEVLPD